MPVKSEPFLGKPLGYLSDIFHHSDVTLVEFLFLTAALIGFSCPRRIISVSVGEAKFNPR